MNLKNQIFLCMDSACGAGSVAVFTGGVCRAYTLDSVQGNQAKQLIPMVEAALLEAGITYAQLDAVACTVGPGSFTGIRIALSAARALGLALSKPVVGVSTLACVALGHTPTKAMLNAGKGEVFAQEFDAAMRTVSTIELLPTAPFTVLPNAKLVGELLLKHPECALPPEPVYIRPPDAKLPAASKKDAC